MSFWDDLKKPLYWMVKNDSRGMESLGNKLGWDWLEQEGERNQKNPGRAIGKAAATAASIYGGGLLGGAAGGAGSAAGSAAGNAAGSAVSSGTAAANSTLAQEMAREAAMQQLAQIPQGLGTATSLGNTGYSVGGAFNQATGGLLSGTNDKQFQMGMKGLGLLEGGQEQQQRPAAPPPPPAAPMPPSDFQGYGQQGDPFAGMSEEQKRRILAMLQQGTMR